MKKLIHTSLIVFMSLFMVCCFNHEVFGVEGKKKIEISINGNVVSYLKVNYCLFRPKDSGWVGWWDHIEMVIDHKYNCVDLYKAGFKPYDENNIIHSMYGAGIVNVFEITDGCSFDLNVNSPVSIELHKLKENKIRVIIKEKDIVKSNGKKGKEITITGRGLRYNESKKVWETEIWRSIDGAFIDLPYPTIY